MANNLFKKYRLIARTRCRLYRSERHSLRSERRKPGKLYVEVSGSAWVLNTGGSIQANGSPIDLVNDLGAQQQQPTF